MAMNIIHGRNTDVLPQQKTEAGGQDQGSVILGDQEATGTPSEDGRGVEMTVVIQDERTNVFLGHFRSPFSTVSAPRVLYNHVEDVERLDLYCKGGYHPINIGDRLHDRYRIVHKLGFGSNSTIWLARDGQQSKYVAVKVGTTHSDEKEVEILAQLTDPTIRNEDRGKSMILPVLDHYNVSGPNGIHPCFVTTPARCSLANTKEASSSGLFQLDVARSLAAQLVMAVAYIHDKGYIHGDLHLGNILLQLTSKIDRLSDEQLYEKFVSPDRELVHRADGKPLASGVPPHVFSPVWLGEASDKISLAEARLVLSDFGVAFYPAKVSRFESYTPLQIRPPEARFDSKIPLSFPSDIWSLGCTIWEILGMRSLLDSFIWSEDDATADQVDILANGQPNDDRVVWSLDQRFEDSIQEPRCERGMEMLEVKERDAFCRMVRSMLSFQPADRPSARELLDAPWMKYWAIPAYENVSD
ncbi:kinase-like domain-containing protein [Xylaria sp. FL1777]|nr:kinase-like domain-containing protein [Xylaria sp. FL1777]